jgi:DNA-binding transcriptional ArsR family regulator
VERKAKMSVDKSTEKTTDPVQDVVTAVKAAAASGRKIVGHFGSVIVEGKPVGWMSVRYDAAVPRLLTNPDYKVAQILSVLGSEVRLSILRILLDGPKTAADVVKQLGLKTTGQAYHHLKDLERAGYVELRGGRYHFNMEVGRVYLTALALAADAGAEAPDPLPEEENAEGQE